GVAVERRHTNRGADEPSSGLGSVRILWQRRALRGRAASCHDERRDEQHETKKGGSAHCAPRVCVQSERGKKPRIGSPPQRTYAEHLQLGSTTRASVPTRAPNAAASTRTTTRSRQRI